jgi:hypothetical protein
MKLRLWRPPSVTEAGWCLWEWRRLI